MTKENTVYLKGWAILFMLMLHFGNKFVPEVYQWSWSGNDWDNACQICVPLFLFFSGYGISKSESNSAFSILSFAQKQVIRCKRLLVRYWVTIFPFVLFAMVLNKFRFSVDALFFNMFALKCSWCPNAWFLSLYIILMLISPLFLYIIKDNGLLKSIVMFLFIFVASKIVLSVPWVKEEGSVCARQVKMVAIDLCIFIEGMLLAKYDMLDSFHKRILLVYRYFRFIIGLLMVCVAFFVRAKLPYIGVTELLHVPLCILGLMVLTDSGQFLFRVIQYIGKHSTTLWFIHGYFIWTFCTSLIYGIRIWPVAYIVFVLMSLSVSIIIDWWLKKSLSYNIFSSKN